MEADWTNMNIKKQSEKYFSNSVLGNNKITLQMKVKLGAYTYTAYEYKIVNFFSR